MLCSLKEQYVRKDTENKGIDPLTLHSDKTDQD